MKEAIAEIRSILTRCQSGELKHNQLSLCGTARCVAGWKYTFDHDHPVDDQVLINQAWAYARDAWGLTPLEAVVLFQMDATFHEQFALCDWLESGQHIDSDGDMHRFYKSIGSYKKYRYASYELQ